MPDVRRVAVEHGRHLGQPTLVQQFLFTDDGVTAPSIVELFLKAPLTGDNSIFGSRPGEERASAKDSRRVRSFSPAPGFRFDVELNRCEDGFIVGFAQPGQKNPYLQGQLLWIVEDHPDGVLLNEQINTARALESVDRPVGGAKRSLRRWLFFKVGHKQVMSRAADNLAQLAAKGRD